jgi:molybdate transport system substrate-binding protein
MKPARIVRRLAGVLAFLAGCGRPDPATLTLHCGAGIKPPVAECVEVFRASRGVRVEADYAGSEVLISKIKLARAGDVYMPGDRDYVEMAEKEGFILEKKTVCFFVPTIMVRKGNPHRIGGLRDLVRPGLKLGLGDPRACAVGRQTRRLMDRNAIEWSAVEKNLVYQSMTVNELGLQIQAGSVDAVIVWDAVAVQYEKYGDAVAIPADQNVISTVDAGVLCFTKDRDRAREFVEFLASEKGREVFRRHRYQVDPPK